jgi:hypothetical protein
MPINPYINPLKGEGFMSYCGRFSLNAVSLILVYIIEDITRKMINEKTVIPVSNLSSLKIEKIIDEKMPNIKRATR